jgi:YfiH family protein
MLNEPVLLVSPALQEFSRHGFVTRHGGVSLGPFASLNLRHGAGDDDTAVTENLRRFQKAAGITSLFIVKQVHGTHVVVVDKQTPSEVAKMEADALVTCLPGATLAIGTADCVPVLLAAEGVVGAAHAGWRGTVHGVVARTFEAMQTSAASVRAALGPSICVRCFEVGEDVAREFDPAFVRRDLGDKAHVDLQAANVAALVACGIPLSHIDGRPPCTMCEPGRFYSHRRDKGLTGRHLSFIGLN